MITILLNGGEKVSGSDATDILRKLSETDWTLHKTTEEYRQCIQTRVLNYYGVPMQFSNDEEFLHALQGVGFIRLIAFDS